MNNNDNRGRDLLRASLQGRPSAKLIILTQSWAQGGYSGSLELANDSSFL
ncbi:mCG147797 [Mus musculus]|nr:mCG147797 [Mus musculus]